MAVDIAQVRFSLTQADRDEIHSAASYGGILPRWPQRIYESWLMIQNKAHFAAAARGWWNDIKTGLPIDPHETAPQKLMLIVSEIAEMYEGYRNRSQDDHLPHRRALEVECADAIIRIADLAGATNIDMANALVFLLRDRKQQTHVSAFSPIEQAASEETVRMRIDSNMWPHALYEAYLTLHYRVAQVDGVSPFLNNVSRSDVGMLKLFMDMIRSLAAAMEGHRRGTQDSTLIAFPAFTVNLAVTFLSIIAMAQALELDVAGALVEKMRYNALRSDHDLASRREGGKAY